jgi:hypothetical protein
MQFFSQRTAKPEQVDGLAQVADCQVVAIALVVISLKANGEEIYKRT